MRKIIALIVLFVAVTAEVSAQDDSVAFASGHWVQEAVGKGVVLKQCHFIVVDGRRPQSAGVSIFELARIMKWTGCVDALNLDGGGSSTLVAGDKIVNRPSDNGKFDTAGERKVANILIARPVSE